MDSLIVDQRQLLLTSFEHQYYSVYYLFQLDQLIQIRQLEKIRDQYTYHVWYNHNQVMLVFQLVFELEKMK